MIFGLYEVSVDVEVYRGAVFGSVVMVSAWGSGLDTSFMVIPSFLPFWRWILQAAKRKAARKRVCHSYQ